MKKATKLKVERFYVKCVISNINLYITRWLLEKENILVGLLNYRMIRESKVKFKNYVIFTIILLLTDQT